MLPVNNRTTTCKEEKRMNEIIHSLLAHRSIRSYSDKPVEESMLEQIVSAVQAAPNWVNFQLVSMVAVKDPERRKTFSALCGNQPWVAEAPVFMVFCADYYRVQLACRKKTGVWKNIPEEDIDTLIVGAHEVGIAIATAVAAAEGMGLGTVVIGDVRKNSRQVIQELNLPPFVMPLLGLCIGYPAHDPGQKPRLPRQAVYFEERYRTSGLDSCLDEYDRTYATYLQERGERTGNWTERVAKFYRTLYHYRDVADSLRQQKLFSGKITMDGQADKPLRPGSNP